MPQIEGHSNLGRRMNEVTRLLSEIDGGDKQAAGQLLPLVYEELRRLATARMAAESRNHTLQPTALVHEAYLQLVGPADASRWENRGHFFAAAADAMRRILVDNARRKGRLKRGADFVRQNLLDVDIAIPELEEDLLALDEALEKLAAAESQAAELVKLRYFAGLTLPQVAQVLNISPRTADRLWAYARAWLHQEIRGE
jgi:RNA polymerase sigma factor (TIGR02999 family)